MNQNMLVSACGLTVKRGNKLILDDISLDVKSGEIVTVIGPNGAGKTTLVKSLLKIDKYDAGELHYKPNIKIGYVPQRVFVSPFMPMTVSYFMGLTGQYSISEKEACLHQLQACYLLDKSMQNLSGGELQRVLMARAILNKPDLLVLDEPAQGMDIGGQVTFYEHIKQIRDEINCGILLVSHDLNLVMSATDKVVCIYRHICCSGHPDKVTQAPEFSELFGSKAVETLALYQHNHNHSHGGWDKSECDIEGHNHDG